MEDLPQLDIQDDIATLCESDDEIADEPPLQDLSKPVEASKPDQIFVKPPSNKDPVAPPTDDEPKVELSKKTGKPKRKMSAKQLEHLANVRQKAIAACKQKKADRLAAEEYAKGQIKQKRAQAKLEKAKAKIEKETPLPPKVEPEPKAKLPDPDAAFGNFMVHMERFERLRHQYNKQQQAEKLKGTPDMSAPPKIVKKPPANIPKAVASKPIEIIQNNHNPYSNVFNW